MSHKINKIVQENILAEIRGELSSISNVMDKRYKLLEEVTQSIEALKKRSQELAAREKAILTKVEE